jgi:hypothetical protein
MPAVPNRLPHLVRRLVTLAPDAYYLPSEVAAYMRVSLATLEYWRRVGGGPDFVRLKNRQIRYYGQDVRAWMQQQRRRTTSDASSAPLRVVGQEGRRG